MSDTPQGPGWWLASDGRYYPPQPPEAPTAPPTSPPAGPPTSPVPPAPGQAWAAPSAAPGAPPTPPPTPTPVPPGAAGGGGRRAVVVLGVLAVVVVVGVLGALALLLVARDGDDRAEPSEPRPGAPTTVATDDGAGGSPDGDRELPSPDAPGGDGPVVATEFGFTTGEGFDGTPAANAGAVLENTSSQPHAFFEVVFTFVGADGAAVATETAYVYAIDAGGTAHASVDAVSLQGEATEVQVAVVVDDDGFWSGETLPVQVGTVSVDDFFGLEVSGTASNPTGATVQGAAVQCVVRQGDRIVGGTSAILDSIVPDGQVAWEAITFSDWLRGDTAECSGSFYE